ncbi:MAG TPA: iron uptake transporter deferrochelatase/peroxidase subunit [Xanthobacteraceae bacterium]|nr:iron uptake transporter deferrochelatase/peroxidase subunit [Xanthobacteraceae bacterium]
MRRNRNFDRDTVRTGPSVKASRRTLLKLGAATGAASLGLTAPGSLLAAETDETETAHQAQPFYGAHQSGIVMPQPAAATVVAFDVLADKPADLRRLFRTLTERIGFLMVGGPVAVRDPLLPPPDSGLLGPVVVPDNLTVTVGVGASLFDDRFGLARLKPKHLVRMTQFPNDALDEHLCHGDILLQFCANREETVIHALRDIIKNTPDLLSVRWKIDGFLPADTVRRLGTETIRNLLGFKDGTANLIASDAELMDRHVWVNPADDEPSWTAGGSYQVVRIIRNLVERWDRTPLNEQQKIIGRDKITGAPLGSKNEHDAPAYAGDPDGLHVPLTAHIRRANPRTPQTDASLILRRGYNFSRGVNRNGQLDMGLLFVCFQSNLATGFLTVQSRLNGEALEEYIKPIGGGYFFALQGVSNPERFLGDALFRDS